MGKIKTSIGLMSGTSMDGIDLALIKTDGDKFLERGLGTASLEYPNTIRIRIEQALEEVAGSPSIVEKTTDLEKLEQEITQLHSNLVLDFLETNNLDLQVDLIGFHGQTILHRPEDGVTVQLGDGELLAKMTGIPVVYDMRSNDMANGGQGAPLAPVYHQTLACNLGTPFSQLQPAIFVNLGGISNVTTVGDELVAFDTGPGNVLMDRWMQTRFNQPYDEHGKMAGEGNIIPSIVARYLNHPFLSLQPPKSLDRLDFELDNFDEFEKTDVLRSLVRVTAETLVGSSKFLPQFPKLWVLAGGGCQNPVLVKDIRELVEDQKGVVITADEAGLDTEFMEAEAWAYLAVRAKRGLPLTYPLTTGCKSPVSGGRIACP